MIDESNIDYHPLMEQVSISDTTGQVSGHGIQLQKIAIIVSLMTVLGATILLVIYRRHKTK
jgi:hypothetical protein